MSKVASLFGGGSSSDSAERAAEQRRQDEAARQARIDQGLANIDQAFSTLTPDFYRQRADAYTDFYQPQLDQQLEQAQEGLIANLARAGLLRSTAANQAQADLQRQYGEQLGQIRNRGLSEADALQRRAASERNALVAQLQSTENPSLAASSALTASQAIRDTTPNYPTLSSVLSPIVVGAGNFVSGQRNANLENELAATNPRTVGRTFTVT